MATTLNWDGKDNKIKRVSLPFQRIEIINDPREGTGSDQLQLLTGDRKRDDDWKNKLIWGDNKLVMSSLLQDFAGKIDLIYIDPPFNVGSDFSMKIKIGGDEITKNPSAIEEKAYRDTWGKGIDGYLQMIYERLVLIKELLAESGSLYLHCDWRTNSFLRLILDEIFGTTNYINEISWCYQTREFSKKYWNRKHDNILVYAKSYNNFIFNYDVEGVLEPYSQSTIKKYKDKDENGYYRLCGRGISGSPIRSAKDVDPKWEVTHPELVVRNYLGKGYPPSDYWKIDIVNQVATERLDYPTQKPEKLLEKIVKASSNEGSIVADFFCGSGTTMAVAEKLGRRWIGCDLGKFAIHTSRKRLMEIQRVKKEKGEEYYPFEILNLGKYERQIWQGAKTKTESEYLKFILELFKAEPIEGYNYLHGKKADYVVHVGTIDSPITYSEINDVLEECRSNDLKNVYILGWEWEMSVYEGMMEKAKSMGIKLRPLQIPKEVMEPQVLDSKDIKFFELNYLAVLPKRTGTKVKIHITDFIISSFDELPEELRSNKSLEFSDYIDYWAVDWNIGAHEAFTNMWQTFRTKKEPILALETPEHDYETLGSYQIGIKVVDVFGNDTSKTVDITIT